MTVATDDQHVSAEVGGVTEQSIGCRDAGDHRTHCLGVNPVAGEVASDVGAGDIIGRWLSSYRVRL
jgi:hypothetical protein